MRNIFLFLLMFCSFILASEKTSVLDISTVDIKTSKKTHTIYSFKIKTNYLNNKIYINNIINGVFGGNSFEVAHPSLMAEEGENLLTIKIKPLSKRDKKHLAKYLKSQKNDKYYDKSYVKISFDSFNELDFLKDVRSTKIDTLMKFKIALDDKGLYLSEIDKNNKEKSTKIRGKKIDENTTEFTKNFNIKTMTKWAWTKATPLKNTQENKQKVYKAYQTIANFYATNDKQALEDAYSIAAREFVLDQGGTAWKVEDFYKRLEIPEILSLKHEVMPLPKIEDCKLKFYNGGKLAQLVDKNGDNILTIKTKKYYFLQAPIFSMIGNRIIITRTYMPSVYLR